MGLCWSEVCQTELVRFRWLYGATNTLEQTYSLRDLCVTQSHIILCRLTQCHQTWLRG